METYTEDLIETYEHFEEDERILYKDSTYDIVSKVAYLIGVPKHIFENEHEPPKLEIYEALDKDKAARIIRNLCVVRAAIERKFEELKKNALFNELYKTLDDALKLNVYDMLDAALTATRIDMTAAAKRQFFEKHIKPMRLVIDEAGNASLELRRK